MRVIVVGGTRFVGRAVTTDLVDAGHEVLLVHRGEHEPPELSGVAHLHVDRRRLGEHRSEVAAFGAAGLVDLSAMTGFDARAVLDAMPPNVRLVVASSMDVYRAFASLWAGATTDPVPLAEDAPLRSEPPPDRRAPAPPGWDLDMSRYEKLDVERAYRERGGVVCRLPFVYGEHDYQRREEFVLRRVRAGRTRMPIGPGTFLGSRGYAGQLARGMRTVLEAPDAAVAGQVFNLSENPCAPMRLWAQQIVTAAGADLELVDVPTAVLPPDLALTGDVTQHLLADPGKAERVLGWRHAPPEPFVARSVRWHLDHPPETPGRDDFAADDAALN